MNDDSYLPPIANWEPPDFTPPVMPTYTTNLKVPLTQLPAGRYVLVFRVRHGDITNLTVGRLDRIEDEPA